MKYLSFMGILLVMIIVSKINIDHPDMSKLELLSAFWGTYSLMALAIIGCGVLINSYKPTKEQD